MKPEFDEIIAEFMKLVDGSIQEISFAWKPDSELLSWINEFQLGSEPVLFRFGEDFILGDAGEISYETWSDKIVSACLMSDVFVEDAHQWLQFSRIEKLTVIASLKDQSVFFDRDGLCDFHYGVFDGMPELKKLNVFLDCSEEAFSHAEDFLYWPSAKFDWRIENRGLKPRRKRRRKKTPAGERNSSS